MNPSRLGGAVVAFLAVVAAGGLVGGAGGLFVNFSTGISRRSERGDAVFMSLLVGGVLVGIVLGAVLARSILDRDSAGTDKNP